MLYKYIKTQINPSHLFFSPLKRHICKQRLHQPYPALCDCFYEHSFKFNVKSTSDSIKSHIYTKKKKLNFSTPPKEKKLIQGTDTVSFSRFFHLKPRCRKMENEQIRSAEREDGGGGGIERRGARVCPCVRRQVNVASHKQEVRVRVARVHVRASGVSRATTKATVKRSDRGARTAYLR